MDAHYYESTFINYGLTIDSFLLLDIDKVMTLPTYYNRKQATNYLLVSLKK